ncbi:MAG TPA: CHAT domain-containing tetratricopeptide repeat protein [Cyclobacteriaceae bacterium]|nr:CHAT domain-containing tetratricopeptide repeat protein [Cyclobacteriaceae bacterium]
MTVGRLSFFSPERGLRASFFNQTLLLLLLLAAIPAAAQKTKHLTKADAYYNSGEYEKAAKALAKYRKSLPAKGAETYKAGYHLREAKLSLALGLPQTFEEHVTQCVAASAASVGEESAAHGWLLLELAEAYRQYGNLRISAEYIDQAARILEAGELTETETTRLALVKAETMVERGFATEALQLLRDQEPLLARRAVDKETTVQNGAIQTRRVPNDELAPRFGDYAKCLMLIGAAYNKMGRLISADSAFGAVDAWLRGKSRYLGETNIVEPENRFRWASYMIENGNMGSRPRDLQMDNILNALKKKVTLTNDLAHEIYLTHLRELMQNSNRASYNKAREGYQKILNKYFPKNSLLHLNMKAVEFDARLNRDKTKNLENQAAALLSNPNLPQYHKTRLRILSFLVDVAIIDRKYANGENYLARMTEIARELYGDTAPEYHLLQLRRANYLLDYTNKIDSAVAIYRESYDSVIAPRISIRHKDILDILNHLATLYELTDEYSRASETLKLASEAALQKYRDDDILYGIALTRLARLRTKLGAYEQAEQDVARAIEVIDLRKNRGYDEYTAALVEAMDAQARLYGIKGLFDEASARLERSAKIISRSKTTFVGSLETNQELVGLLIQLGRFANASRLLDETFAEYERTYGSTSIRLINPLLERGRIQLARGEYGEAQKTAQRAYRIAVDAFGETSTKTAPTQLLLGELSKTLGDYDQAGAHIAQALKSQEKQFGRNHIDVASSLSQLALIRFYDGDKNAESLLIEARDIIAEKLGKQNPRYATSLENLAIVMLSQNRHKEAFDLIAEAAEIWKAKTGSRNNINLAALHTLTGDVYYQQRDFDKASDYYERSRKLYEKFFSTSHPEYVKATAKLSRVHYMQRNYKASKRLIEEALGKYEAYIADFFPSLSEREKARYWNTIRDDFEFYYTLAFSNLDDFKDLAGSVYNYQLMTKALLLSASVKMRHRIMNSPDEALRQQFDEWVQKKERLTLALSMTSEELLENEIDPDALRQEVEQIEKQLSSKSEDFARGFEKKAIRYGDVIAALGDNEVAVELVRFRYFDHTFTDSVIYAALHVRKASRKPGVAILANGRDMETRYFKYYRNAITGLIHDSVSYHVYWQPLQQEIGMATSIYLSPDGVYNQINLEAIPTPDGKYVIDNTNLVLVSNTRDLAERGHHASRAPGANTAYMFGNPKFYLTASGGNAIPPLPGTGDEVMQLDFLLREKGWTTQEFIDAAAAEEALKGVVSPRIFHIATHGLYRRAPESGLPGQLVANDASATLNPLLRTGLLLSGAGDLLNKTRYNYNLDNGILTAYEAMSLNLDQTDLVVLSACETGLGDVQHGEGVYGLQRAFLVAGAKVLVMSMFRVDDEATRKLMLRFYQNWLASGKMRESFTAARKELRNEYPAPLYWGAFLMIGLE